MKKEIRENLIKISIEECAEQLSNLNANQFYKKKLQQCEKVYNKVTEQFSNVWNPTYKSVAEQQKYEKLERESIWPMPHTNEYYNGKYDDQSIKVVMRQGKLLEEVDYNIKSSISLLYSFRNGTLNDLLNYDCDLLDTTFGNISLQFQKQFVNCNTNGELANNVDNIRQYVYNNFELLRFRNLNNSRKIEALGSKLDSVTNAQKQNVNIQTLNNTAEYILSLSYILEDIEYFRDRQVFEYEIKQKCENMFLLSEDYDWHIKNCKLIRQEVEELKQQTTDKVVEFINTNDFTNYKKSYLDNLYNENHKKQDNDQIEKPTQSKEQIEMIKMLFKQSEKQKTNNQSQNAKVQ